jgi:hypothetical protein
VSRKPNKVQRLMRLNAFQEERADDALRLAVREQALAREAHAVAQTHVDGIGKWKAPGKPDAPMDLAAYGSALEFEQRAMVRADALRTRLVERERSTGEARNALTDAVGASRVSNKRGKREATRSDEEREKRAFDQVSDVWLNNRKSPHD